MITWYFISLLLAVVCSSDSLNRLQTWIDPQGRDAGQFYLDASVARTDRGPEYCVSIISNVDKPLTIDISHIGWTVPFLREALRPQTFVYRGPPTFPFTDLNFKIELLHYGDNIFVDSGVSFPPALNLPPHGGIAARFIHRTRSQGLSMTRVLLCDGNTVVARSKILIVQWDDANRRMR